MREINLRMQQPWQQRIVIMLGHNGRPIIAFSDQHRATEWLTNADNMASVQLVYQLTDGVVDAGEEVQEPARFLSRTQPPDGIRSATGNEGSTRSVW